MERWTGTPEGTCNVLRTFRETHAISAMASSTSRIQEKAFRNESLDRSNAKDSERVVRLLREVDVVSAFSSSTSLHLHKKPAHQPSASVLVFLCYRTAERAIRATV